MNTNNLIRPVNPEKFEPGRPVYVLLHKDHTHFHCLPTGEMDWDYDRSVMELREKILEQDFGNKKYGVMTLADALPLFSNRQAEIAVLWKPVIQLIQREKDMMQRRAIYERFYKSKKVAHPIEADELLKQLLGYK